MLALTGPDRPAARTRRRRIWAARALLLPIGPVAFGSVCAAHALAAQIDPTGRSGEPPPLLREEPRPTPPPVLILPPLPPPLLREPETIPRVRVLVREIRVEGSTVFSPEELAKVTAPYLDRELTAEDLEALRRALTLLYVNNGYVNSGAILPDQTVTDGVVTYQIIEGTLADIQVQGNRWFRAGYFRGRLALGAGPPLNINALQEQLQLLLEDSRIGRLNADLKPGLRPGEGILDVRVEERLPFKVWLEFNNYQSPSVGAERGLITAEHQNFTGNGDILTLTYGRSAGLDPLLDFKYVLPFTARDTTLILQYRKNTFAVIEAPFELLDIETKSDIYTVTLRQPLYSSLSTQFALEVTGEHLSEKTFLLGEPFTLSPGANNGKSVVSALRFAQEWVYRTSSQVVAARSRFSVGVDELGATINNDGRPSGKFFAWLGQFQWVRRLGFLDTKLLFRTDLQIANDPLLVLEQFAVWGRYTVRGYRENTLVRDSALIVSAEARVPIVRNAPWADYLELAPFVDYGKAWNARLPTLGPPDIWSAGIGLRWAATVAWAVPLRPQLEVYWGYPFRNIKTSGGDLQDHGLHLQFILGFF